MRFLSTLLMFGGYMLVYAAVAAGGKFATEPWAGLFADAYTESTDPRKKLQPDNHPDSTSSGQVTGNKPGAPALRRGLYQH